MLHNLCLAFYATGQLISWFDLKFLYFAGKFSLRINFL